MTGTTTLACQDASLRLRSALVELGRGGASPPLFCLHAQAGHVELYAGLASHLTPARMVYGLRAAGLDGERTPYRTFEAMAQHHARTLRTVQPHGPYLVAGECLGGPLAYELAQQLRASGEEVALLVLIDSFAPGQPRLHRIVPRASHDALHRARILGFHAGNLVRLPAPTKLAYASEKAARARRAFGLRLARAARRREPVLETRAAFRDAVSAYEPRPYAGAVALFRAEKLPLGIETAPDLGWGRLVADLAVECVPGYFTTPISEPGVRVLAGRIGSCIGARTRRYPTARLQQLDR